MSPDPLLELRAFQVAFGAQQVLSDITLTLPTRGMTVLLGPAGSGKSTLLRTLGGLNQAHPSLVTRGTAVFRGRSFSESGPTEGIGYVMQKARFLLASVHENIAVGLPGRDTMPRQAFRDRVTSLLWSNGLGELVPRLEQEAVKLPTAVQRRLAIVRAVAADPQLLLVDEPTAGLENEDALQLIDLLRQHAEQRAVLVVTHNQAHAQLLGGTAALLADGRILEVTPTPAFFRAPWTPAGKVFVRTGGYTRPPADDEQSELPGEQLPRSVEARLPTEGNAVPSFFGPRGFYWVKKGRLGGLPRPGIVASLREDVIGLKRLGVTRLVTLEEGPTVPVDVLAGCEIASTHFPIVDMGVPDLGAALALCERLELELEAGAVIAYHCRAGLGRTGTLLACHLIVGGASPLSALESVRQINPRCIQSEAQAAFLTLFHARHRGRAAAASAPLASPPGSHPQPQ